MVLSNSVSIQRVWTVNGCVALGRERRVGDHGAVERQHGRHAVDHELGQRAAGPLQRLLPGGAGDDQLGQQRVEGADDLAALLDTGVEPHARARSAAGRW